MSEKIFRKEFKRKEILALSEIWKYFLGKIILSKELTKEKPENKITIHPEFGGKVDLLPVI